MSSTNLFQDTVKKLPEGGFLHVINIEEITPELKNLIDENLPKIHSASEYNLERTKKILRDVFKANVKPYNISDVKMGAIAEFFVHLYFSNLGFQQECLFQNLEDQHSIKKGHDGYYSYEDEAWIMESKSTATKTEHQDNIDLAYSDLKAKISGKNKTDDGRVISPWDNALNHALRVKSSNKIVDEIKSLSNDFIDGKYHEINDFNIIPASTVFLNGVWQQLNPDEIFQKISECMKGRKFKKINVICVTKRTTHLFLDYLNT